MLPQRSSAAVFPLKSKSVDILPAGQRPVPPLLLGPGFQRKYSDVIGMNLPDQQLAGGKPLPQKTGSGFYRPVAPVPSAAQKSVQRTGAQEFEEHGLKHKGWDALDIFLGDWDDSPCRKKPRTAAGAPADALPKQSAIELDISKWPLPQKVVDAYRRAGITKMFEWQAECLRMGLDGSNLVYSAPTSAGKTLVAEMLLLKKVVETRKKGLFILPFISVAREKMLSLQKMLKGSRIRVDGYMGAMHPRAGLQLLDVAVCTIEKANSLINRLVDEKKLDQIAIIVVDELHMVGDAQRGYLIELLLTKVRHLSQFGINGSGDLGALIQVVGMSATLPNLPLVAKWLDARLYTSDYRPVPLRETVKLGQKLYDNQWRSIRDVPSLRTVKPDPDHVVSLCFETVQAGHSVLVFCPTRAWCESLALSIAVEFSAMDVEMRSAFVHEDKTRLVVERLRASAAGLDSALGKTVPYVTAFHHAGLTMDERDILEDSFKKCAIKVLVATTTLSCGVNLPARRVIIRSPMFNKSLMDPLTYRQMVGRAGRKGIDTEGESVLICKESERAKVATLLASTMEPVVSCLLPREDGQVNPSILRAVLEIIANGAARTIDQVHNYMGCTLFSAASDSVVSSHTATDIINSLDEKDLISISDEFNTLSPTQLGSAVVWSGLTIPEGFVVYAELERARAQLNLENELHILYLITPLYLIEQVAEIDWYHYMSLWQNLPAPYLHVAGLVGIEEKTVMGAVRGGSLTGASPELIRQTNSLRRFYCALMLNDLANEVALPDVARKYQCNKGTLQALQQGASTYAGMVTVFCEQLGGPTWSNLALLFDQFQQRLLFGVQRELVELMRIELLSAKQARVFYKGGYKTLDKLASAKVHEIEELLLAAVSYQRQQNENALERKPSRNVLLQGKPHSELEAADAILKEAQRILRNDAQALTVKTNTPFEDYT